MGSFGYALTGSVQDDSMSLRRAESPAAIWLGILCHSERSVLARVIEESPKQSDRPRRSFDFVANATTLKMTNL